MDTARQQTRSTTKQRLIPIVIDPEDEPEDPIVAPTPVPPQPEPTPISPEVPETPPRPGGEKIPPGGWRGAETPRPGGERIPPGGWRGAETPRPGGERIPPGGWRGAETPRPGGERIPPGGWRAEEPQNLENRRTVVLNADPIGRFISPGTINGVEVDFLIDTGATHVSVPDMIAARIGLIRGEQAIAHTAAGQTQAYLTSLDTVSIGDITLSNVNGAISPEDDGPHVLLGMSFLEQLKFNHNDGQLILNPTVKPPLNSWDGEVYRTTDGLAYFHFKTKIVAHIIPREEVGTGSVFATLVEYWTPQSELVTIEGMTPGEDSTPAFIALSRMSTHVTFAAEGPEEIHQAFTQLQSQLGAWAETLWEHLRDKPSHRIPGWVPAAAQSARIHNEEE